MSELTKCNYCSMKNYQERAKRENARVITRSGGGTYGGRDVYIVPNSVKDPDLSECETGSRSKYWISWQMGWSTHCVC